MNKLLSHELWAELAMLIGKHNHLEAAIAYVTTNQLNIKSGDVLICDASDKAIRAGSTSAQTLRDLSKKGVHLFSVEALHAKCFVIDGKAAIGSANMSERAETTSIEAMLFTDELQVVSLVTGFIETLRHNAKKVDSTFIERILKLPIEQRERTGPRAPFHIPSRECRIWFVSTKPLSDKQSENLYADPEVQAGQQEAVARKSQGEAETWNLLFGGTSKFRRHAAPGDIVIACEHTKRGATDRFRVYQPMTVLHSIEYGTKRHFYLEDSDPSDKRGRSWTKFEKLLTQLDVSTKLTPTSVTELEGNAARIIQLMK